MILAIQSSEFPCRLYCRAACSQTGRDGFFQDGGVSNERCVLIRLAVTDKTSPMSLLERTCLGGNIADHAVPTPRQQVGSYKGNTTSLTFCMPNRIIDLGLALAGKAT